MSPSQPLYFRDECHVEPWKTPKGTVVPIHGIAETNLAWAPWVPTFSREYRVVIPDLPGCGESPMTPGVTRWSIDALADVLAASMRAAQLSALHLVGAKLGGTIALGVAARHPDLIRTLTVVGSPVNSQNTGGSANISEFGNVIRHDGLRGWAADTMRPRLGSQASDEHMAWWTEYMSSANVEATLAFMASVEKLDLEPLVGNIQVPTLLVTTRTSALASVAAVERWASLMPHASVDVVEGDAYHLAVAYPDTVASRVKRFIDAHA
jgi:pimeloyl-ACP methyl ester carboxylesterase